MSAVGSARVCVVSDGIAGNRRQAAALAQTMGLDAEVVTIGLRAPWDWFAPRLTAGAGLAVHRLDGAALAPPWPDLAIGCGRRAAWLLRLLKARSGGRCYTVQILDPRIDAGHFDVVVAPRHDGLSGPRVLETIGSLNPVGPTWLAEARARFAALAQWPQPRVAVLIGAGNGAQRIDAAYFRQFIDALAARHAADGGSFLVTLSRRTPAALRPWLRQAFAAFPGLFWDGEADGENPYAGLLAFADRIVVTPDSVNMLSEAAATGRPVATFAPDPIGGKFARFHASLRDGGWLQSLEEPARVPARPLAETAEVAAEVLRRWRAARATR